jgi:catechol 2,3-dioxygenase-like lactoylglutathione lyase family enzyme
MPLRHLNHVNIRTGKLAEMQAFYTDVLGLVSGPRPGFSFGGAWMYCEGLPVVHLVQVEVTPSAPGANLRLEHFAFAAEDMPGFLEHLGKLGIPYTTSDPPGFPIRQVHIYDPDGNHIHVDFETAPTPQGS